MSILKPTMAFDGVASVDLEQLKSLNIKGILLDIDNTLIDMYKNIPTQIKDWVAKAKEMNFSLLVLSNSNNKSKKELIAKEFGVDCLSFAKKPFKSGYLKACKKLGLNVNEVCMIGDQVFTDVLGANRVGMCSIYVKPINKKEYWYTAWKRSIEDSILKHYGY